MNSLKEAVYGLKINKVRTALTVFGLVIGIAAVIVVLSAGNSVQEFMLGELDVFGSNYVIVEVKIPNTVHHSTDNAVGQAQGVTITTLTTDDLEDVIENVPEIQRGYAGIMGQEVVSYLGENKKTNLYGVSPSFVDIDQGAKVASGTFFTDAQNANLEKVVVVGKDVRDELFGIDSPVGKMIRVGKEKYTVIGVMEERGADIFLNLDDMILVPVKTLQKKILGVEYVSFFFAEASSEEAANTSVGQIEQILRINHHISGNNPDKDDFAVVTQQQSQNLISEIISGMTIILIAIAGISLVVGGVGIMNIMYVTVAERTYEIGLRKAIGATRKTILRQFLLEAVMVTFLGGIVGIMLGVALSYLISIVANSLGYEWPFSISVFSILLGTGVSTLVGLVFGLYPAKRAAQLDPINALRSE